MTALFPVIATQALGFIGNEAKKILKQQYLSGQMLDYRPTPGGTRWRDEAGRPKASYRIKYAKYVVISSYPANFFTVANTRQRVRPIWKRLKDSTNTKIDSIIREYDAKYLQKELEKFDAKPHTRKRY